MDLNLFDTSWVIFAAGVVIAILTYTLPRLIIVPPKRKKDSPRILWKRIIWISAIALVVSIVPYIFLQSQFPEDIIPPQMIIWCLLFGITLGSLPFCFISKRFRIISTCLLLPGVIVAALSTNNYYRYYPSITALFHKTSNVRDVISSHDYRNAKTPLESYYLPLINQPKKGTVYSVTIPASGHYNPRSAYIYVPPALAQNSSLTLPVIVLLGGFPGAPVDWINGGMPAIMDNFAAAHKGLAPIVVVPDITGEKNIDTECVDSPLGDVETYLTKDIPTYVKEHYQAAANPADWTIAGYSEGGTCSSMVAARNPNIYRSYVNITGDSNPSLNTPQQTLSILFGGSEKAELAHNPTYLFQTKSSPLYKNMHAMYYLASHDSQSIQSRLEIQAREAKLAGISVKFQVVNGHHGFEVWRAGLTAAVPWLMQIDTIIE